MENKFIYTDEDFSTLAISTPSLICFKCAHKNQFSLTCKAFPDGVPYSLIKANSHSSPLPTQKNDIVFESKK